MSKQNTTAGKTAKTKYNAERVNRWRKHAEMRSAEIETLAAYNSARLIADQEGKPLAELIVSILCRERLRGKIVRHLCPTKGDAAACRLHNAHVDTFMESHESTRRRDNHERGLVSGALETIALNHHDILVRLNGREKDALLRRFYDKGDLTAHNAVLRAVRFAVGSRH